jgi:DNA-binding IclR family transcriptional regulator
MDEPDLAGVESSDVTNETGRTRSVPVLVRSLTILELLANSSNGLTLPEVARKLHIPKSSTHCILLTLLRQEYVDRSERTRRYVLGQKLFSLVSHSLAGQRVREAAMPHLRQLMLATNLTVHMGVLDGSEAILVAKVDPPGVTGLATWLGRRMEVHCTGVGKALIAHLPPQELEQLLRSRTFPRHNENTIVSAKRLLQELESVRSLGYATDDEEDEVGYRCIGAPVFEHGRAVAAVSVAGTVVQVTSENTKELVRRLSRTSEAIGNSLQSVPTGSER